ncbi:MAG: hypothetical protein P9L99_13800 [Candidatus Lernaella stagnicola]|nr:hypothetical protein [Candidatus Lernaella stagnicola]
MSLRTGICLTMAVLALGIWLAACGGGDAKEIGANSNWSEDPPTGDVSDCDRYCTRYGLDDWYGCFNDYAVCQDNCNDADCVANDCTPSYKSCQKQVDARLVYCADQCESCLVDTLECLDDCSVLDNACLEGCYQTLYTCHDWNYTCRTQCNFLLGSCLESTLSPLGEIGCQSDYVECLLPCRQ